MQNPDSEGIDSAVPLFDVVISMPPGAKLETIQKLAETEAGLPPERVERLMKVLRSTPNAKVGAGVSLERAEEEKARFIKAGLHVEVTPLLTVQTLTAGSFDGLEGCPACGKRAVMPKTRQCPSCGVFIDKLTDEYLLKKKIMQQELGAIEFQKNKSAKDTVKGSRESVEAAIRAQVRAELEKKYGISKDGFFKGKAGLLIGTTLAIVMGLLYAGEKGVTIGGMSLPWGKKDTPAGAMSASSLQQASSGASAAGGTGAAAGGAAAAAGASGAAAVELTGDADVDDILIQAAAGKKSGGKGLTMEEAIAASKTLAKSVGNTTAERAIAGAPVGGPGGTAGAKSGGATATGGAGAAAGAGQADAAGAASSGATDTVPKQARQLLTAEFASLLAEIGQGARAREVLKAMAGGINPATDAQAASALQAAQLKLQAWSVQRMDGGRARQAAEDLKATTQAIVNAQERTQLQGQVAVILSRNAQLPPEVPRMFLSMGAESLKAVGAGQTNASLGDLAVSMAEVFLHETTARARAGGWTKARASAAQVEDLLKQAPDAWAQTRLYALDHQAKLQTGQTDKAAKSLESALALAGKNSNLIERAIWLRSIAQLSDASTQEQFEAMATALQNQLNAKSGVEKARGLTELSLLYTAAGLPGKASQLRSLAQATTGLSAADSVAVNIDLVVRSDMVMAKLLHGLGRYAEAEAVLQRVGGYLF